jgi:tetratricopeptide (TPR) repeat protein
LGVVGRWRDGLFDLWRYAFVSDDVTTWMSRAREHERAGRLDDEAAELYRHIMLAEPAHREAPNRLVQVLEAQGRLGDAVSILEAAIRQSPERATLHGALADALHAQGDRPRAIEAYRRAIALDPALEAA